MRYEVFNQGTGKRVKTYKTFKGLCRYLDRSSRQQGQVDLMVACHGVGTYDAIPVTFNWSPDKCGWSAEPKGIPYGSALLHSVNHHSRDSKLTKALSYGEQR